MNLYYCDSRFHDAISKIIERSCKKVTFVNSKNKSLAIEGSDILIDWSHIDRRLNFGICNEEDAIKIIDPEDVKKAFFDDFDEDAAEATEWTLHTTRERYFNTFLKLEFSKLSQNTCVIIGGKTFSVYCANFTDVFLKNYKENMQKLGLVFGFYLEKIEDKIENTSNED